MREFLAFCLLLSEPEINNIIHSFPHSLIQQTFLGYRYVPSLLPRPNPWLKNYFHQCRHMIFLKCFERIKNLLIQNFQGSMLGKKAKCRTVCYNAPLVTEKRKRKRVCIHRNTHMYIHTFACICTE